MTATPAMRARIEVRGIVQGVGFRPFVYRLAQELELAGWVNNDGGGVTIEVEGARERVQRMTERLARDAPPRARIDAIDVRACTPLEERGFAILASGAGGHVHTAIGPDTAVCDDCLAELFDPRDRRYRYPFVNCTNCGPRYTIARELPYDRAMTSMAGFAQCHACLREYTSPLDRRFHAEPNACPECGPRLALLGASGAAIDAGDPITEVLARIARGQVVAIKGLGGFHLACDARNGPAVAALRARKAREEKPFAIMAVSVASLAPLADVAEAERDLLVSVERPIVLLRKRAGADEALPGVAPGLAWLGAMLPYTPLHYLLFHEAAGRPTGTAWLDDPHPLLLVMTSANPGGEPIVTDNDDAVRRLAGIADAILVHDRAIVTRCDDSVMRVGAASGRAQFVRRARGYTPRAIPLAAESRPILALGAYFKSTVCVTRGREAFVSQHVGDLDNAATCRSLEETVLHLLSILDVTPEAIAHDLHPDFYSTRLAVRLADRYGVPRVAVQHHHAHVASVAAEHRVATPILGLALDGVGLGTDGAAWGGELMRVDGASFARLGHLAPLRLPGGDIAAREPWRMAASALASSGRAGDIAKRFAAEPAAPTVAAMLASGFRSPETTSMGRWFDAAAGLLDVRRTMAFEGQAAMLLEGLAEVAPGCPSEGDPRDYVIEADTLSLAPLLMRLASERDPVAGARRFHTALVAALAEWVARAADATGLRVVACAGGCFLNDILARELRRALDARGIAMLEAQAVPPNDGGLSLGQAWVAQHEPENA
ncbi:MAG: carbamoyltransferase HypF [Burkholderiales bacterium]